MQTPFVHLFKTSSGCFVYDVNTDVILKVPEDVYLTIKNPQNNSTNAEKYIYKLKKCGYLKGNKLRYTEHPETRFIKYYAESKVEGLILQLTQNCNLRCKYCVYSGGYYNRTHTNKKMEWNTARKAIDFLIEHSWERPEKTISFYGGEPLLEFSLMKKCILWAEKKCEDKILLLISQQMRR